MNEELLSHRPRSSTTIPNPFDLMGCARRPSQIHRHLRLDE
jgi:hypothetical protein